MKKIVVMGSMGVVIVLIFMSFMSIVSAQSLKFALDKNSLSDGIKNKISDSFWFPGKFVLSVLNSLLNSIKEGTWFPGYIIFYIITILLLIFTPFN